LTRVASLGRILVVDDEAPVLEVLGEYFTAQGYEVATASGGLEALTVMTRTPPDLVLLDIRMPGMDGVEVLRRLRHAHKSVPVIMVTANEDVALARETLKIGAFDYVAKPFDFQYLDRVVAAGMVQSGGSELPAPPSTQDTWTRLVHAVFRAVRGMSPAARVSTGERLEDAVLYAVREVAAGRPAVAAQWLAEVDLLLGVATEFGDLSAAARSSVDSALGAARTTLPDA
jgi:CheY-like chemotaxis protein